MSGWVRMKPAAVYPLDEAEPYCRSEASRRLVRAYLAWRGAETGAIPRKNGLDLPRLGPVMEHMVLSAVSKPDKCLYRLAGEEMKARIGMNPVGRNYYDFVPPERVEQARRAMNMVIDTPCGFRAEIDQRYSDGRSRRIECLGLPLASDDPTVDGFILFSDCEIGRAEPGLRQGMLLGAQVVRRELIDIGFGVDERFEDVIAAPSV
ncbi:MAG: PAS domain-containing protein [Marivibrio sp.]|uniref:PAS domain-containing protein n=1 Tax=Marivibrio sp. TaxID=2039719 RepID=UPI0032EE7A22